MTSNEYVIGLAEVMGVERTEIATVDRVLARRGFRQLARGKSRPDINLTEGVQIALAWAGAENLTRAADEIERFYASEFDENQSQKITSPEFFQLFGEDPSQLAGVNFLDVLITATRGIGTRNYIPSQLHVHVTKKGGMTISFIANGREIAVRFKDPRANSLRKRPNVETTVSISGEVLKWIYDAAEGSDV